MFKMLTGASHGLMIRIVLLPLLLAVNGCGGAYATSFGRTTTPSTEVTLTRLYVYSFLDIRSEALGPQMMGEIARQLSEALESRGVSTEQHWFRDDPLSAGYNRSDSTTVPINRVVAGNASRERRFGADYRLLAFPAWMELQYLADKPYYIYVFQWTLEDSQTGRVVWSTVSTSNHLQDRDRDKDAVGRASEIVNRLMREMEVSGLIGAAPAERTSR